jgi:DNA-binding NarL/FixJ family response regulator
MPEKSSLLLVDDHPAIRLGLSLALANSPHFTICGEADDVASAHAAVERLRPDAIVLDLLLGGRDGIELIEDLLTLQSSARILVYSSLDEQVYASRSLRVGAKGYLMKREPPAAVAAALAAILRGEIAVSSVVQQQLLAQAAGQREPAHSHPLLQLLSHREMQVLRLIGLGRRQSEIASELNLSVKTVSTYRERLKDKLGCASGGELEVQAHEFARTGGLGASGTSARRGAHV